MRTTLVALGLAAGIGLVCCESSAAAPAASANLGQAAAAASSVQPAQYAERRIRHGFVKCYREAVVGPYRCHYYGHWW